MKSTLIVLLMSLSVHAYGAQKIDYSGPRDMSAQCGDAIADKLSEQTSDVAQFLENPYSVSFDWGDESKTEVAFTIQFDQDVRDGYATGNIKVNLKGDDTCEVGLVDGYDIGD